MEEKRIPSFLLNLLLTQVNEMLGRRSLLMLLRQAGLAGYIDNLPLRDGSPSITVGQYSRLLSSIYDTFGARDARFILLNGGHLAAIEIRRQHPARWALARTALKVLAADTRMRVVLERLVEQSEDLYGTPHYLDEEDAAAFVVSPHEPVQYGSPHISAADDTDSACLHAAAPPHPLYGFDVPALSLVQEFTSGL